MSLVLPCPVTGGAVGEARGRLDFDRPGAPADLPGLEAELVRLVAADLPVTAERVDELVLDARPGLQHLAKLAFER